MGSRGRSGRKLGLAAVAAAAWLLAPGAGPAVAQTALVETFPVADGDVRAIAEDGGVVYLGGSFATLGPFTGSFARVDALSGVPDLTLPRTNGPVSAIAPDGAGGWYLGGSFTQVGGQARSFLARILADGRLSAWNPSPDGVVRTIVPVGPTVYLGGAFLNVGGQVRARAAAVDASTGSVLPWNPNVLGGVGFARGLHSMAVAGTSVFLGGDFQQVGGVARNNIAKVSATGTGTLDATWNPNATPITVYALLVSGSTLYVGGSFTTIGGQSRTNLAALSTTGTGAATAWNPSPNNSVYALVLSGTSLYVGGFFTSIGNPGPLPRQRVALVDTLTGAANGSWDPGSGGGVYTLSLSGGLLYLGGSFATVAGQPRLGLAAVDALTGALDPWDPGANDTVTDLVATGATVQMGGSFTSVGARDRARLGAVDLATGAITAWDPGASGTVYALAAGAGTIYAGGVFLTVAGTGGPYLAALDAAGGLLSWDPNPSSLVHALDLAGTRLVAGGSFNTIGNPSLSRPNLAALDTTTAANLWAFPANNGVEAVAIDGTSVFAGGYFTSAGGWPLNRLAKLDLATGAADTGWNPNPSGTSFPGVGGLLPTPGALYVGGRFSTIGGQTRNGLAAVDPGGTGTALAWNPDPAGGTQPEPVGGPFALRGSEVVIGGDFYWLNGLGVANRRWLGTVDATTAAVTPWYTQPDNDPWVLRVFGDRLFVGGEFATIGGQPRRGFAVFCMLEPPTGLGAVPDSDNTIQLSWTGSASSYNVYRALSAGGPYQQVGSTGGTSFDDTSAEGGVNYFYVVKSAGSDCESSASVEVSAATTGLCSLPPEFEGAAWAQRPFSWCQIDVGWAAASSPCGGGSTYAVYRDTSPSFVPSGLNRVANGLVATTHGDLNALSPSTTYSYVVRATSTLTGQEDTNLIRLAASTGTCSSVYPAPVQAMSVTSSSGNNRIEWKNPGGGPFAFTRIIYKTAASVASCSYPGTATDGTILADQSLGGLGGYDFVDFPVPNDGTVYCYAAFVSDGAGRFSSRRTANGRPFDTMGPVKWAYSTGATSLAPPAVGTNVLTVSNDRFLHAMVPGPGVSSGMWPVSWTPLPLNGPAQSRAPVVPGTVVPPSAETVFLGVQDGYVYVVDALTGALRWTSDVRLGDLVQAAPAAIFTAFGGAWDYVLVGSRNSTSDNRFYALNVTDGTVANFFDNGGGSNGIGIISGGATVVYGTQRVYFASRARAGASTRTLWCLQLGPAGIAGLCAGWPALALGDIDSSPVHRGGRIYVGNNQGRVYAIDATTGAEYWYHDTADGPVKGFVFPDRASQDLFFATSGFVHGLTDSGGSAAPVFAPVSLDGLPSPAVLPSIALFRPGSTSIYAGGTDGRLYQIDFSGGSPTLTSVVLGDGGSVAGAPTLDRRDDVLYVGSDAGIVYAVQAPLP